MTRHKIGMIVFNNMISDSRVHKEASSLGNAGFCVRVIAIHDPGLSLSEFCGNYEICRMQILSRKYLKGGAFLFIKMFELLFRSIVTLIRFKPDVIHAHDLLALVPGAIVACLLRIPLIYDSHELHTERNGDARWLRRAKFFLEHLLLFVTDQVLMSDGQSRIDHFNRIHNSQVPILDIGNFPELSQCNNGIDLKQQLGIAPDSFLLVYAGSIQDGRGIISILPFLSSEPDAYFLLLGDCVDPEFSQKLDEAITEFGLEKQVFRKGSVSIELVVPYLRSCDLGICLIENTGLSYYYSRPTKMFEYAFAGLPFLASDFPEMVKVVNEVGMEGIGSVVDPANGPELANVLRQHYDSYVGGRRRLQASLVQAFYQKFNWGLESVKLVAMYQQILKVNPL